MGLLSVTLRTVAINAACAEGTVGRHGNDDAGVGPAGVKKLPQTIVPSEVNNSTYRYQDAMEMFEDMRRLRRATGWTATWVKTASKAFVFHLTDYETENRELEYFAQFEVSIASVQRDFWPGKYGGDPRVLTFRKAFFSLQGGPSVIAQAVNETPVDSQLPETASVWNRLLGDDDLV